MTINENAERLLTLLGEENTQLLLRVIRGISSALPLLSQYREYVGAVSQKMTEAMNIQSFIFPELVGHVCIAEYVADAEGRGGLFFQIEDNMGALKVWFGDREYAYLFSGQEDGTEGQSALSVEVDGKLPKHVRFFLMFLSKAQEQLVQQLTACSKGDAVLTIEPQQKN